MKNESSSSLGQRKLASNKTPSVHLQLQCLVEPRVVSAEGLWVRVEKVDYSDFILYGDYSETCVSM